MSLRNIIIRISLKIFHHIYTYALEVVRFFNIEFSGLLLSKITINEPPSSPILFDSGTLHRGTPPLSLLYNRKFFKDHNYTKDLDGKNKYAIYSHFGVSIALESYFFDRLKRNDNSDELEIWMRQINWLEKQGLKFSKISKKMNGMISKLDIHALS